MVELGYGLSSEEHHPLDMVRNAQRAEEAGFTFGFISDHFHPWVDKQGHSPFVWNVIGGIAAATQSFGVVTAVTCPIIRIHPAIIAQAAATSAAMLPGRFVFGVGTGENLNEHVVGQGWPPYDLRADMLDEALMIIRELWEGDVVTYYGEHYTVEEARIYTLPDEPPPIVMASGGENSAELAGEIADGLMTTSPEEKLVDLFKRAASEANGAGGDLIYGKVTGCYAPDRDDALQTAYDWWSFTALPGELSQELRTPQHYEQAVKLVREEDLEEKLPLGPDAQAWKDKIQQYLDTGYTHVCLQQIGPDQQAFIDWAKREILPDFR